MEISFNETSDPVFYNFVHILPLIIANALKFSAHEMLSIRK